MGDPIANYGKQNGGRGWRGKRDSNNRGRVKMEGNV